jgi:F0F1-type ATP synthase membrane subunit b/b'
MIFNNAGLTNILLYADLIACIGILVVFIRLLRKKVQNIQDHKAATKEYDTILRQAYAKSRQLLESTSTASQEMLNTSKNTNENLTQDVDRIMQKIAQQHIQTVNQSREAFENSYNQYMQTLQQQLFNQSEQALQKAETTVTQTIETFSQSLLGKTLGAQELVDAKVQALVGQAEKDINDYKKRQMEKVDAQIADLVQRTYEEVFKRSIPENLQQELIFESLEKAKKEGMFRP